MPESTRIWLIATNVKAFTWKSNHPFPTVSGFGTFFTFKGGATSSLWSYKALSLWAFSMRLPGDWGKMEGWYKQSFRVTLYTKKSVNWKGSKGAVSLLRSATRDFAHIPDFHTSSRILPPTEWIFVSLSSPEDIKRLYRAEHALAFEWNFDVANFSRVLSTSASKSHSLIIKLAVAMIALWINLWKLLSRNHWWYRREERRAESSFVACLLSAGWFRIVYRVYRT